MGLLDKIIATANDSVRKMQAGSANTYFSTQRENAALNALKSDLAAISQELNSAYTQIGKKYCEYLSKTKEPVESIGADDFLRLAEQKMLRKEELEKEVLEIEKRLKDQIILQEKAKMQADVDSQIERLKSAKSMGVVSDDEYNDKVLKLNNRLINFDAIRNIEKQFEMGIITLSEKEKKLAELL